MWFKRRKKTEQDHALSESLRSLQSLLSETGRTEPTLDPKRAPPRAGAAAPDEPARRPQPRPDRSDPRGSAGNNDGEPAVPESGSRWRDLNLSFDAEPAVPRARRDDTREADEQQPAADGSAVESDAPEESSATGEAAAALEPDARVEAESAADDGVELEEITLEAITDHDTAETGPEPDITGIVSEVVDTAAESAQTPATAAPAADSGDEEPWQAADESDARPSDPEPTEEEVVYYDDFKGLEPTGPQDEDVVKDPGQIHSEGDEPDLEIDLYDAGPGDAEAAASSAQAPDRPDPDRVEPAEPETVETTDATDSTAGDALEADDREEDQLPLALGLEKVSEDDIPTLTDAVYVPDAPSRESDAPQATEEPEAEPAEAAAEQAGTAAVDGEPAAEEPEQVPESTPEDASDVADERSDLMPPPPGPGASPHDENVEQCIDNLRIRLQLMGLDTLTPGQEKELRDTLVEFLVDFPEDSRPS